MLFLRLSLLLLYVRIFATDKVTRYLTYFETTFCILAHTILMFLNIFLYVEPVVDTNKALGAVNLFSDICILCAPIAAFSTSQLSVKKKIGIMLVFMIGTMYIVSFCQGRSDSANVNSELAR